MSYLSKWRAMRIGRWCFFLGGTMNYIAYLETTTTINVVVANNSEIIHKPMDDMPNLCNIFTAMELWVCSFSFFFCVNAHFVFFYVLLLLLKHYLVFTDFGYFFKVSSLRFVFVWFNCYLNYFSGNAFSLGTFCYTLFSLVLLSGFSKFKSYGFAWYCINWCGTPVSQSLIVVLVELLDDSIAFETNK